MKSYNHLFEKLLDDDYILSCINLASKGKRNRREVKRVYADLPGHIEAIKCILLTDSYSPRKHIPKTIVERGKTRQIAKPDFWYECIVQHMVIGVLEPILIARFYKHSCASIPNRGISFGKRAMERFIRKIQNDRDPGPIYALKIDIRKFFENVNTVILKKQLGRLIRDKRFLKLCHDIIDSSPVLGLPLGYVTSQWFANLYLTPLDNFIKQTLRCEYMIRYMDDVVILSKKSAFLRYARKAIEQYLAFELKVCMKKNYQVFKIGTDHTNGRPVDFMGFKFYLNRTTLRKSSLSATMKKIRRVNKKPSPSVKDSRQLLSRLGWMKQCQTHEYFVRHIKQNVNVKALRRTVSDYDRRLAA